MEDEKKTKKQLIEELKGAHQQIVRLEGVLKRSQWQQKAVIDNISDVVGINDLNGIFLFVTPSVRDILGYEVSKIIGQNSLDYIHPEDLERVKQSLNKILEEGQAEDCYRFRHADGHYLLLEGKGRAIKNRSEVTGIVISSRDITERKLIEEALWNSEQKYRNLFENANEAMFVAQDGKLVFLNPRTSIISGYSTEELMSKPFIEFIHRDDREMVIDRHIRRMRGEELSQRYDFRIMHKDSGIRWVELNAVYINWNEKPATLNFMSDITGRKLAEEALRESEERYRTILNEMEEGYQEVDLAGNFTFFNKPFLKLFGYSGEEMMGTHFSLYAAEEAIAKKVYRAYNQMYRTGFPIKSHEWDILRKDGARRTLEFYASILRDSKDRPLGFRGIVRDVTDRKQAENDLRESELFLKETQKIALLGGWKANPHTDYLEWTEGVYDIVEAPRDFKPCLSEGSKFFLPEYIPIITECVADCLVTGKPFTLECEAATTTGRRLRTEVRGLAAVIEGERSYVMGTIQDITDRKQLEERLSRAEKMEALGQLAGGVAHDLNNVLGVLVGYSELLLEKLPAGSPLRRYADSILQSGIRGAAIIEDLLTLARRGVSVSEVVDLNRVVSDYLGTPEFEKLKVHHPQVHIRTALEKRLLNIKGSHVHLGKVVMNLVSNAIEAISGRGEVTIKTDNRYLDQSIRGYDDMRQGEYVVLTVSDTGSGISADDLGKIFEPFYTKKVMGKSGTGLGLSVVWGTVKDHNGYIDVQSEEGKGSAFSLYFPVTREEILAVKEKDSPAAYTGRGESILVVDDVTEQRELAVNMLVRLGYRAEAVVGGEQAIEYLKDRKADLVVLDMIMAPGIDGLETYRRMIEINPAQKAIIVSGFSETDRVRNAQEMGAGAFVRKPYLIERLGAAVRKELDRI